MYSKYENSFYLLNPSQDKIIRLRTFEREHMVHFKLTGQGSQGYMYSLLTGV